MKLLLRRNIHRLGQIGDVVEVRPGYARNYLLPQGLAVVPNSANLKAIEVEKKAYLAELARQRAELEALAKGLDGKQFTISALANEEGHLYGSVGPAQIVAAIGRDGIFIKEEDILLDEPLRQIDNYEVRVRFGEEVTATIGLNVVRAGEPDQAAEASARQAGDQPPAPDGEDRP